jgi:hypothetical protein
MSFDSIFSPIMELSGFMKTRNRQKSLRKKDKHISSAQKLMITNIKN